MTYSECNFVNITAIEAIVVSLPQNGYFRLHRIVNISLVYIAYSACINAKAGKIASHANSLAIATHEPR